MKTTATTLILAAGLTIAPPAGATIVSYWSFDTDASDATGAHDGSLVGGAAISAGGMGFGGGEALVLSADGDYCDLANPTTFDFNSDFTWHARIKTTDGSGAIFSRNPAGTAWNQGSKALFVRGNNVDWDTGWVGNPKTGTTVNDDVWHTVIVTYNSTTDLLNVFVDPAVGATTGQFSAIHDVNRFDEQILVHNGGVANTSFTIGRANFSGGLASLDTLTGLIDDAAVFDTELTGAELDQLIDLGPASFLDGVSLTTFTGGVDSDIGVAGNWDNGLPTNDGSNPGIVPSGFAALSGDPDQKKITFQGTSGYDGTGFGASGLDFNVTFSGEGNSNFGGSGINLEAGSSFAWNSTGTATATSLTIDGSLSLSSGALRQTDAAGFFNFEGGSFNITGGSVETATDLEVEDGSVVQTAGDVVVDGELILGEAMGAAGDWQILGGSVQVEDISFPQGAFTIGADSTAVLLVLNSAKSVAEIEALIAGGQISTSDPFGLAVDVVDVGGTDYTEITIGGPGEAEVTWDDPQNVTGPSDILTTGTLIAAVNADNGGDQIVDPGGLNLTITPDNTLFGNNPFTTAFAPSSGDPGFDAIMNRADWDGTNPNATEVVIGGLTPGETYAIQFFVSDTRTCCNTRSMEITGGGNTATVFMGDVGGAPNPAQYVVGRFVAEEGNQVFTFTGTHASAGNLRHPQLNAYVLRTDVPATPLRITSITYDAGSTTTTLVWDSIPDHFYRIDASTDMRRWFDLDDAFDSQGESTTYEETNVPVDARRRYYRIVDLGLAPP